jgi:hypothetical protein
LQPNNSRHWRRQPSETSRARLIGYDAAPYFSRGGTLPKLNVDDFARRPAGIGQDLCCKSTLQGRKKRADSSPTVAQIIAKLLSIWLNSPPSSVK